METERFLQIVGNLPSRVGGSNRALAGVLGVTAWSISNWRNGKPIPDTAAHLMLVLDWAVDTGVIDDVLEAIQGGQFHE